VNQLTSRAERIIAVICCSFILFACNQVPQSNQPVIKLSTEYGDIFIELNIEKAPISANNFLAYVQGGHFDELAFYRTVTHANDNHKLKIAVLQGGIDTDFDDVFAPEFLPIAHESTASTGLLHKRGAVSFARGDVGTAQSEFFISTDDNPPLDAGGLRVPDKQGFAVFGQVIKGMEVVDQIAALPSNRAHYDSYVHGQVLDKAVNIEVSIIN
jgi:peptidyl-prolyl cis-trans isomerase A (cyclophilin A)